MNARQTNRLALIQHYQQGFGTLTSLTLEGDGESPDAEQGLRLFMDEARHFRGLMEAISSRLIHEVNATDAEVDPDDRQTAGLWETMQALKAIHARVDRALPLYRQRGDYLYSLAVVARADVERAFDALSRARTVILEHDADASGFDLSFDSVEALMKHVEGDE